MRWRHADSNPLSTEESFGKLTVDSLKPLARLVVDDVPQRKTELVSLLTEQLSKLQRVRALYGKLDPLAQQAVQEAAHNTEGRLHPDRFVAQYGRLPEFHEPSLQAKDSLYDYGRR